jgi:UDP-N-acetylglucosamine--N-acetylmuramyl-(pentapeptide) pyrophosphoryl-undecaprenol N-acetylglucosamine transferase
MPGAIWGNLVAFFKAMSLVRKFKPNVVLGTGGYVSMPVGLAARLNRVPLVLQEQNSVPGMANRVLSRWADEIHLAFAESRRFLWKKERLKLTGNPVRRVILSGDRRTARSRFGLDENLPTVFVFGGSRGARRITQSALEAMRHLKGKIETQYILQTGKEDFSRTKREVELVGVRAVVVPYVTKIHEAYAAADIVVCRAGAMTLAEIAACGVPSILIPFPHAAYNHQVVNAESLVERGAAALILDHELDGERLAQELLRLLQDRQTLARFSVHARTFARPDAAERIARSLLTRRPSPPAKSDRAKTVEA